jgi:predicted DNA-binding transcriptional regulator AlpA
VSQDTTLPAGQTQRHEIKKFGLPDPLRRLPADVTENRMLITKEAAALCGYSPDQWRELYQCGLAPPPVKLSARRYAWKLKTLLAWLDEKAAA